MSYTSGKDGSITCDGVRLAKVASWSLSSQVEALEVTSLADAARNYTPGLKSSTGSCSIWLYDDNATALMSKVIRTDAPSDADKVNMTLGFGAKSVTFQALLTSCELQMAVGSVMQVSLQFQCCGEMSAVVL
jgi:hypothetical protein